MDLDTVSPDAFGASLRGLGINILVSDVPRCVDFLTDVFAMRAHQGSADFAIMVYQSQVFQLHSDATYAAHPLQALLPENPPRGLGVELRLYDSDPDTAAVRAEAMGAMILHAPSDKPHGLRECAILGPDGYLWVPSRPL
ncbi:MAG: glyoxalase [Marinovum sp.]|nr:glyoxalase [Marinovum sp.]